MAQKMKGRSLLTLKDWTPQEVRYVLDLSHQVKKETPGRQAAAEVPRHEPCAAVRETLHQDAVRLRDRLRRRGRPSRVPLHGRHPPGSQGGAGGHRAGPGPHVRRHPVPGVQAGNRGVAGAPLRRARVQRAHRRVASHPGPRGPDDAGGILRQPQGPHARVRGRRAQQRGAHAPCRVRADGCQHHDRRPAVPAPRRGTSPVGQGHGRDRGKQGGGHQRISAPACAGRTPSTPTCGFPWEKRTRARSASACCLRTR